MTHYLSGSNAYVIVDLVRRGVLSLVGKIRRYRNYHYYYYKQHNYSHLDIRRTDGERGQTDRQTDAETLRLGDTEQHRQAGKQTNKQTKQEPGNLIAFRYVVDDTDREIDTDRQADTEQHRQTDKTRAW